MVWSASWHTRPLARTFARWCRQGSASGRYTIAYNGEIYNFRALRAELESGGHVFRGHSDTEVLLAAFEEWDVERALQKIAGMFALSVWDEATRVLSLARDRMGEKPLYVGRAGGAVIFASELRAFLPVPEFRRELDPNGIASLLRIGYIAAPQTIYRDAYKISPGCLLQLRGAADLETALASGVRSLFGIAPVLGKRYWALEEHALAKRTHAVSLREAADSIDETLKAVVREHLVADVPVGAFLSGGVDSSLVVAAMQAQSAQPVRTFTIAFPGTVFDESSHAEAVAKHLGTRHETFAVEARDLVEVAPALGAIYDEPFADSSQIPNVLVSRLARQHVTVCLSGDGGDELVSGYSRYNWMRTAAVWASSLPRPLRVAAAGATVAAAQSVPEWFLSGILAAGGMSQLNTRDRFTRIAETLREDDLPSVYQRLVSYWQSPSEAMVNGEAAASQLPLIRAIYEEAGAWVGSMLWDQLVYLPGDNLAKVDRASMSVALETRLPLLDYRLVETVWRLGLRDNPNVLGHGKALFKEVLFRYVPARLIERPKMGFTVPLAQWLRGPQREWAGDLLGGSWGGVKGHLRSDVIARIWQEHQSGARDHHARLWPVLMLACWARSTFPSADSAR